jgi:hypothetical protein
MFEILAAGGVISALLMGSLLVVKDAKADASKIEDDMTTLYREKTKLIDKEIIKTAKEVIAKTTPKTGELSSEDHLKFAYAIIAGSNLQIMKNRISTIKDRTCRAYKEGVVSSLLLLLSAVLYDLGRTYPNLNVFAPLVLAMWGGALLFYLLDGIFIVTPVRNAEKVIRRLMEIEDIKKLNEEAVEYLRRQESGYVEVSG